MQLYIRGNCGIAKNRDLCLFRSVGGQTCNRLRDVSKISCAAIRVDRGRSHAAGDRQCCVGLAGGLGIPVGGHGVAALGHGDDRGFFCRECAAGNSNLRRLYLVLLRVIDRHSIALIAGQCAACDIDL